MKSRHCHRWSLDLARTTFAGLFFLYMILALAPLAFAEGPSVPARFVRDIKTPGIIDVIERPSAMHFDRFNNEILVGDAGRNRILIFEATGVFKYEFDLSEIMTSPRDITVDPEGFIYILGSDPSGPVFHKFDFDGTSMARITVPRVIQGRPVELRHLLSDDDGVIFALDHSGKRFLSFNGEGTLIGSIDLPMAGETQDETLQAYGSPSFSQNGFLIPVGNAGTAMLVDREGQIVQTYGRLGSKPGTLTFPVAAETSPEGIVMVLDRMRYCVVCYTPEGRFLGEFGGRGFRAGWFLGPFLLAAPTAEHAVIGQLYRSRIQICAMPRFIRNGLESTVKELSGSDAGDDPQASIDSPTTNHPQRRSSDSSLITNARREEFPSPNKSAQTAHELIFSEVSE